MASTAHSEIDTKLQKLQQKKDEWAATSPAEKAKFLRAMVADFRALTFEGHLKWGADSVRCQMVPACFCTYLCIH